jgi:hypothetical protein
MKRRALDLTGMTDAEAVAMILEDCGIADEPVDVDPAPLTSLGTVGGDPTPIVELHTTWDATNGFRCVAFLADGRKVPCRSIDDGQVRRFVLMDGS